MRLAAVLLRYVWLEVLCAGPLDLPQLTSERRATYRVRQVAWFPWRMHVNRGRACRIDVTLLFGPRCEYERLLAVVREELGADHDELVDLMTRWSRCRGRSGESAILAFRVVIAW